jgi:formylglycine-generating enzyme required for sulfatase activity
VNYVSWGDSARFSNWLTSGDTEHGSYDLNGATSNEALLAVERIRKEDRVPGKKYYCIPTEDEWYKAAYYNKGEETSRGELYWDYPTRANSIPTNIVSNPDPGNNANYYDWYGTGNGGHTIGSPYYRTPVGEFENSKSPYGTFDQGGNVWEWNESVIDVSYRGLRGGSFYDHVDSLHASDRSGSSYPTYEYYHFGFRVSEVPEPATAGLFLLGGLLAARRRRALR